MGRKTKLVCITYRPEIARMGPEMQGLHVSDVCTHQNTRVHTARISFKHITCCPFYCHISKRLMKSCSHSGSHSSHGSCMYALICVYALLKRSCASSAVCPGDVETRICRHSAYVQILHHVLKTATVDTGMLCYRLLIFSVVPSWAFYRLALYTCTTPMLM